jgi:hypothetical protein
MRVCVPALLSKKWLRTCLDAVNGKRRMDALCLESHSASPRNLLISSTISKIPRKPGGPSAQQLPEANHGNAGTQLPQ